MSSRETCQEGPNVKKLQNPPWAGISSAGYPFYSPSVGFLAGNIVVAQGGFRMGGFDGYLVKSGEFWAIWWYPIYQMVIIIIFSLINMLMNLFHSIKQNNKVIWRVAVKVEMVSQY